ncbi:MAG: hypothetical protein MJZ40_01725 [Bacteroidaceae bacterium]|nr:hypothetical protein [Bacteroidaceae bacterium]
MRQILLHILLLALSCSMAQAQNIALRPYCFSENWTFGVGAGMVYTMAENTGKAPFSENAALNIHVQAAKWFHPTVGLRAEVQMGKHKGCVNREMTNFKPNIGPYGFKLNSYDLQLLLNLTNCVFGYDEERRFDLAAFVGGGWLCSYGFDDSAKKWQSNYYPINTHKSISPMARAGAYISCRVHNMVSLALEGAYTITNDKYNGVTYDNHPFDSYCDVRLGLTFHIADGYEERRFRYVTLEDAEYYSVLSSRVRRAYEEYLRNNPPQ